MAVALDLADIQGNILSAYGKLGFPKGRFILLHVGNASAGRKFVNALLPEITTALRWRSRRSKIPEGSVEVPRPQIAVNIAFSFYGLLALGIPTRTLRGLPDEFIDGMMERAPMLGDDFSGPNWPDAWDEVWTAARGPARITDPKTIHILVTLNAQMNPDGSAVAALDAKTREIEMLCEAVGGVIILSGHNRPGQPRVKFQELSAIMDRLRDGTVVPSAKEHFGFTDAIGDPVFEGEFPGRIGMLDERGNGAVDGRGNWRPIATGEFLLGYPDEAQEIGGAGMPLAFSRNGTFIAYRKLHQNVDAFRTFLTETAAHFGAVFGIDNPADALETLKAKIAGRWSDGVPLARASTAEAWRQFNEQYPDTGPLSGPRGNPAREQALIDFTYNEDPDGLKCPFTSHMRRVNTRDGLAPTGTEGSVLNNRRRILRRGLPYGESAADAPGSGERGIVMLIVCASLFRQFEFVQQQWINYGLDARSGNDTCPLTGNHARGDGAEPSAKYVIPSDPQSGRPPFIVEGIPQFVEMRGGDYFFVPSMTALRLIGMGVVDPT
jgi:deferrochelatase/peroxidase EfeB